MVEAVDDIGARAMALPSVSLANLADRVAAAQEGRFFLWIPVLMVAGIWSYFALPIEPSWIVLTVVVSILAMLAFALLRGKGGLVARVACAFLVGFTLAKVRTEIVAS